MTKDEWLGMCLYCLIVGFSIGLVVTLKVVAP